jgi:hypothetical protein
VGSLNHDLLVACEAARRGANIPEWNRLKRLVEESQRTCAHTDPREAKIGSAVVRWCAVCSARLT